MLELQPNVSLTLGEVLVQVELEAPAAEAEHLGSLGQEAGEVHAVLAHWVGQQEGPNVSGLALWRRRLARVQAKSSRLRGDLHKAKTEVKVTGQGQPLESLKLYTL